MRLRFAAVVLLGLNLMSCSGKSNHDAGTPAAGEQAKDEAPKSSFGKIPLLVVSETGGVEEREVLPVEYRGNLGKIFQATEAAVLPATRGLDAADSWGLRTVVVGVGLKLGIFSGTPVGLGASGGIRLAFSNSVNPSIP